MAPSWRGKKGSLGGQQLTDSNAYFTTRLRYKRLKSDGFLREERFLYPS